jgi:hypothetical protein
MSGWTPGVSMAEYFYAEAVRRVLDESFPGIRHAAALIGPGSDVLGFDTPRSSDHGWGPRLTVFIPERDWLDRGGEIAATVDRDVPPTFEGLPTVCRVTSPRRYFIDYLSFDMAGEIRAADWLTFPSQKLRSIVEGKIFHDSIGLASTIERFRYYPRDVWIYLLASAWQRIGQEEPFVGRTGEVDDDLGSRIIAARLVRDAMSLAFLMEREYAPYSKWFGTAFGRLACAEALGPHLGDALRAESWASREAALGEAFVTLARLHNALGLTEPIPAELRPFHDRPFRVIEGERFAEALCAVIEDPEVRRIAARRLIGSIDTFSDSTDLKWSVWRETLTGLYETEAE